eukprot:TRINITY_DN3957_c0_g1_i1.p1 TRINITY_DN3957_c0_g1~~TRINITY_DN3957_c0_g1_i1.p1  ORF type:complete len:401 (-),score=94.93 TRINITY_DN3957_c0_g1_i1:253-1455(-)
MATFVDLASEEEQVTELLRFYYKIQAKEKNEKVNDQIDLKGEASTLVKENKTRELLEKVIDPRFPLFTMGTELEIEVCFNVTCSLLRKLDSQSVTEVVKKMTTTLVANKTERSTLRLKILNNLYNMFDPDSLSRYEVFYNIVQYAHESKNAELVTPHFAKAENWLRIWKVSVEHRRNLYKLFYRVLKEIEPSLESHKYLVKHLSTVEANDAAGLQEVIPDAVTAAVEAIQLPEVFQCDHLLEIPAIAQLEKSSNETHVKLFQLLKLFAVERLDSFYAFHQKNPNFLQSVGLAYDDCLRKIRLLSLASLAAESEEIPYSAIAKTLQIEESEVETWVIFAVSGKIMEAKMNQVRRVVAVERCTQRVFTQVQWKQMSTRLHTWKDNVTNLLQMLQSGFIQPTN